MGLIKTAAKVAVASSVHGRVQRRQQQRWAAQDQAAAQATQPGVTAQAPAPLPAQASPSLSTTDKIAHLKDLAGLRDAGVLTEQEFEAEKRKLLDG
jgi:Short C-terminal domain